MSKINTSLDIPEFKRLYLTHGANGKDQILNDDLMRLPVKLRFQLIGELKANGWYHVKKDGHNYAWNKDNTIKQSSNVNDSTTSNVNHKANDKPMTSNISAQPTTSNIPTQPTAQLTTSSTINFNLSAYLTAYYEQLKISRERNENNIFSTFHAAVAIRTKTAIYQDLPLKTVAAFEKEIDWEAESEGEDEIFRHPYITHYNPTSRVFVSSFISGDNVNYLNGPYGINMMVHIAKQYGYTYLIVLNESINRILKTCQRNFIPSENVIILNNTDMDLIYQNGLTMMNEETTSQITENDETLPWQLVPIQKTDNETNSITLRPYQLEYLEYMNTHEKAIMKLPCGMGKSLIMIYHMMTHKQNSIILVPNIALVNQFHFYIEKYYNAFGQSLPEIHRISTKDKEFDITDDDKQQIVIIVYNSFVQYFIQPLINKQSDKLPLLTSSIQFPYMYIDEAHHIIMPSDKIQKKTIQELMNKFNEFTEEEENMSFVDVLNDSAAFRKAFSNLIYVYSQTQCSHVYMFSATITPSDFSKYNMFSAIEDNYLCRLNVDVLVDNDFDSAEDVKLEKRITNLINYLKRSAYKSIIIYCSRVATAKKIHKQFGDVITSAVITASDNATNRDNNFKEFRNRHLRALITVNCISEGVDLPEADTAIFFDDRKSIVNIIQCVGRVMRKHPAKLSSTFVIPVYKSDDVQRLYDNILTVLNGDLGYGVVDLRRILTVKYDCYSTNLKLQIINDIGHKIIEYNKQYFSDISIKQKLNHCMTVLILEPGTIPGYNLDWKYIAIHFKDFIDSKQFILENIHEGNRVGLLLRSMYGLIKVGQRLILVKGLSYRTPADERDKMIKDANDGTLPKSLIINDNVIIHRDSIEE